MSRLIEIPDDGIIRTPIMRGEDNIGEQKVDLSDFPVVDAVPVVRCRECEYRKKLQYDGQYHCCNEDAGMATGVALNDNDFCSYGAKVGSNNAFSD